MNNSSLIQENAALRSELERQRAIEYPLDLVTPFQNLPGLRGLWAAGSADNTGAMYDLSEQGRTLTYNGNPTVNIHNSFIPYWDYDGTGDFHSRADEAGLDLLGNETIFNSTIRGLTLGGWFWFDAIANRGVLGKWNDVAVNQRSYVILLSATVFAFYVSSTGADTFNVNSTVVPATGGWYFLVGRYTPSTEVAMFVNNSKTTNTTAIPAALFNSTSSFKIPAGDAFGATNYFDGRCALAFLSNAVLPDAFLTYLWHKTRPLFGV